MDEFLWLAGGGGWSGVSCRAVAGRAQHLNKSCEVAPFVLLSLKLRCSILEFIEEARMCREVQQGYVACC